MTQTTGDTLPVDGKTLPQAYLQRIAVSGSGRLFRLKRDASYTDVTWNEAHQNILGVFNGLKKAGIKKGDAVCIMSQSRPEWFYCDLAAQAIGAVTVPIYHSNSTEDCAFIVDNCEAKLIFADDEATYKKLQAAFAQANRKAPVIVYGAKPVQGAEMYNDFAKPAAEVDADFRKSVESVTPDMLASIVYTSGTTGRPKGAMLKHSCLASEMRGIVQEFALKSSDITVTFLPFAHVLGRIEMFMPIYGGITLGFAENINSVALNMSEIKPTLLVSVPRIYEKIFARIQSEVESQSDVKKNIFRWALDIGRQVARLRSRNESVPLWLHAKFLAADQLVFAKIRAKLGGNLRFTVSGGAPLSPELCEIFHACGIKILEGYGLTETTAAIAVNRPENWEFGTVGKPLPQMEVRIAEDGEILLRGPQIFHGYYKDAESTKEVLLSDGWFCTGDIGEITARGHLKITDRKKELIVTSGGKKVAPQKLENMIKNSRFMSNGFVYGDKQKYLIALITLNEHEMKSWAKQNGVEAMTIEEISRQSKVVDLIDAELKQINTQLASYESIKRFKILPTDFTVEAGELTPSLKIKRKVLIQKFGNYIQELYA